MKQKIEILQGEYFWGGSTSFGTDMPVGAESTEYSRDFRNDPQNQMTPVFLSNKGRYIWIGETFKVWIEDGCLCIDTQGGIEVEEAGDCLRDAYIAAMKKHFPFSGKALPREFFETAQYNTWMEFTYNPTQEGVIKYAREIIEHGFEPGILIIDEGWHGRYGQWKFDLYKFPNPKEMIAQLHEMGFIVMLWVTPLVTPDGQEFTMDTHEYFNPESWDKLFLRNKEGEPALIKWWNGYSAILDFRKKTDWDYLDEKLQYLMSEYGVDGFKFDGGPYEMYTAKAISNGTPRDDTNPREMNIAWNEFGIRYKFHEYKDTFMGGGRATIQRLCDRRHRWDDDGINTIIPCSIMQGLEGYPFICPDMIGGGEWSYSKLPGFEIDEELFVRMAQASALCPMMQFSWAPWRALSTEAYELVAEAAALHKRMAGEIVELVSSSEKSGEPILRCMEYNYPNSGYEKITDEFMLGTDILVCPVIKKNQLEKDITLPAGRWKTEDGTVYEGGRVMRMNTPLEKLLWFRKED